MLGGRTSTSNDLPYSFVDRGGRMTTRHLVDPELVAILDTFPALTPTSETLPLIRTTLKEAMARHHASEDMLDCKPRRMILERGAQSIWAKNVTSVVNDRKNGCCPFRVNDYRLCVLVMLVWI